MSKRSEQIAELARSHRPLRELEARVDSLPGDRESKEALLLHCYVFSQPSFEQRLEAATDPRLTQSPQSRGRSVENQR